MHMIFRKTKQQYAFRRMAFVIVQACTSAQSAPKPVLPADDLANLTATMVLKVAFQTKSHLLVKTSVLANIGKIRVMRVSSTAGECIVKIERDDAPDAIGWGVREKLCWER